MTLRFTIPGEIGGKDRPRFGNGRIYTTVRTKSDENYVGHMAKQAMRRGGINLFEGAVRVQIELILELPLTKAAAAEYTFSGRPATGRPDLDNVAKLICDSLNKIAWKDDAQICDLKISRRYVWRGEDAHELPHVDVVIEGVANGQSIGGGRHAD